MKNIKLSRLSDLTIIAVFLPFILILIGFIFLVVKFKIGSPVFFRQIRPGLNCKPFEMIKFRTMSNEMDLNGVLLPDGKRLTGFGKFLRSSSLDELPELWNVFKGEMSLVGPRPLLMEYLPLYSDYEMRRHEVRPGVTGWAQVNGRNALSWKEKFDLDVWYVDNHSLALDAKILFFTIKKVFMREGVSAVGEATMPRFQGSGCQGDNK